MDMAGNVWEWVHDRYAEDYYAKSPAENPTGPATGYDKVLRGGSFSRDLVSVRTANRSSNPPNFDYWNIGFRCVIASNPLPTPEATGAASMPTATSVPPADTPVPPTRTPTRDPSIPPSNPSLHDTWFRTADGMETVYVPGGTFQMGFTGGFPDGQPVHTVTLEAFWIDRTEVTNSQYAHCVADGACGLPDQLGSWTRDSYYSDDEFDEYPVTRMNWYDADTYCQWAGGRLPTEAEWEYAARGPDGHIYPWGDDPPDDTLLNYYYNVGDTTEVGAYPDGASWVGAMDMAGNVWEWVADWYGPYPAEEQTDPKGPETGSEKVLRGGSWSFIDVFVHTAFRWYAIPDAGTANDGFRCVVDPGN
jgi:serine/threonine-protein kinase